ncbi:MAG: RNA polymerase sigma factor [Clostridiales bacterium]|nr:RNA polymerase sigma factor [Clostridiales bacterium]
MTQQQIQLVTAAQKGDAKSFEELYGIYYEKIYALARMILRNGADAEDVLQETFITAWRKLGTLEHPQTFSVWLQKIAKNLCYMQLRRKNIVILLDAEKDIGDFDAEESDELLPAIYAEREDLQERLGRIIDSLSDVQRQAIVLYYFNEMSVPEIADVMECSEGTVKSRLFFARKTIRAEIEERERKSGERFFGIAGIPMLPFGKLVFSRMEALSISQSAASASFSAVTSSIAGSASTGAAEITGKAVTGMSKAVKIIIAIVAVAAIGIAATIALPKIIGGGKEAEAGGAWGGEWYVSGPWGEMTFTQSGNTVTGAYEHAGGTIEGTVSGNVVTGTWDQGDTKGPFELTLSGDGMSFDMIWGYEGGEMTRSDTGTRITPLPEGFSAAGQESSTSGGAPETDAPLPGGDEDIAEAGGSALSLEALKQAAADVGFEIDNSMASTNNAQETLPRPEKGFCIVVESASLFSGEISKTSAIFINAFASAEDAQEYAGYVNDDGNTVAEAYIWREFCVEFANTAALEQKDALIAAFAAIGWGGDDRANTGGKTAVDITALYEAAGYFVGPIEGAALQGAASGLNCMGAAGVAQFYFHSSDAAATAAKAAKYDVSAAAQLDWICKIDGHIVYMGNEAALAVYDAAR